MSDRKTRIETNGDETRTLSNIAPLSLDSDSTESNLHQLDMAAPASNASISLGRLEQDLRVLHAKWHVVEQEIAERDEKIAQLQVEIDDSEEKYMALESDLDAMMVDKALLADELLAQKRQFEDAAARQSKSTVDSKDRIGELESRNTELQVHLQELQAYIDGRMGDWSELQTKLREYEDTIQGMSGSVDAHDKVVAEKEEEKAALALKVMELERELAELKGRHMEKESSHEELQQALEEQSRELGSLNGETIRLHKDIEELQKKLESRDATVRSLKKDLKERSRDGASLEASMSDEKAVTAKVQKSLDAANHSIADLESSLRARKAAEEVLRDDVAQSARKLDEMRAKATEFEIRSAELQAMLLESESEQKSVGQELEAQRELVQVLEHELGNKQENLDILDRSVDRLSAIGSEIRELDVQIDDLWIQQPAEFADRSEEIFEHPDEVLLDPEVLFDAADERCEHVIVAQGQGSDDLVRFPLHGREVTIGRSRRSNIRLDSKYISRIHARIKVDGASAIIEDAGSTNGFVVNSVHKTHHELVHGDKLEIGDRKLQYLHTSSAI